jgi:hypothetical protein
VKLNPFLAGYLAGVSGQDIVGAVYLTLQSGGRKPHRRHLRGPREFFRYLENAVHSTVDNFRRHSCARIEMKPVGLEEPGGIYCDPGDPVDLEQHLVLRDLIRVLLPRILADLSTKPKQQALFEHWIESFEHGDLLPINESNKFLRHCLRNLLRRHFRALAAEDLGLKTPTGTEILRRD